MFYNTYAQHMIYNAYPLKHMPIFLPQDMYYIWPNKYYLIMPNKYYLIM